MENAYLVWQSDGQDAVLIDPGENAGPTLSLLAEKKLRLKTMICTHGHVDHIMAASDLQEATQAEFLIHPDDEFLVKDLPGFCGLFGLPPQKPPRITGSFAHGDKLERCGINIEVIATPGHTPGGVCFKIEGHLFTGDTLFRSSIGRTDLPGGNYDQLMQSIRNCLLPLDDKLIVHSGHGPDSTLGLEKSTNPFLT